MNISSSRRSFLTFSASGIAFFTTPGLFAEMLSQTPRQVEGPWYPNKLPLDTDNDLLMINDSITPGVGEIVHLSGRVLGTSGSPVRNAIVEIWQTDNNGIYIHTESPGQDNRDRNFQGYGRFLTNSNGEFYFRTIKPVHYGPRTAHIHLAVNQNGKRMLTTQIYTKGHPKNSKDRILNSVQDTKLRDLLIADYKPLENSKTNESTANIDIVIGLTPEDKEEPQKAPRRRKTNR